MKEWIFVRINWTFCFCLSECWDVRPPGENYLFGIVNTASPNTENPPALFYFGEMDSADLCKEKCGLEPLCFVYTYTPPGPALAKKCYGVGYGNKIEMNMANEYSGIKLC